MSELKNKKGKKITAMDDSSAISTETKINLLLLGVLSVSFLGFFALRTHWVGLIFAHTAALGIMGFYGSLAGSIARKKGYLYWAAFRLAFFLPILLGLIAAFLFVPKDRSHLPLTCGGWVSLGAGIVIVLFYSLLKKNKG